MERRDEGCKKDFRKEKNGEYKGKTRRILINKSFVRRKSKWIKKIRVGENLRNPLMVPKT